MKTPRATSTASSGRTRRLLLQVLERIGLLILVGGSLWAMWWSVDRVGRVQKESADLTQKASRLTTEIELMQSSQEPEKTGEADRRYARAQGELFDGTDAIQAWQDELHPSAVPLALDTRLSFVDARTNLVGGRSLAILQATVDLEPAAEIVASRPAYGRVLDFVHGLTVRTQRVDLVELRVRGGSDSVSQASATVELWAADSDEEVRP